MANKPLLFTIAAIIGSLSFLAFVATVGVTADVESANSAASGQDTTETPEPKEKGTLPEAQPALVQDGKIYLWDDDSNFPMDSYFSPSDSIQADGTCGEETWVFSANPDGKVVFAHNYNLQRAGELGRTTQGLVAGSQDGRSLIFSNVGVAYWPSGRDDQQDSPQPVHLKFEADQSATFEITGQAQRFATIYAFKLNGTEYQSCEPAN